MAGGFAGSLELLYVNATPDDRRGYNALANQAARVALFDKFLQTSYAHFRPDRIAIACNTLSVLYDQTTFSRSQVIPVDGIVSSGVALCRQSLMAEPQQPLIIFATETTTEAATYPRLIQAEQGRLVAQSCPGLAHAISNDASGIACRQLLKDYATVALAQFSQQPKRVFAFLGCTHFGYQTAAFKDVLAAKGVTADILNPNDLLIQQLLATRHLGAADPGELSIRFISKYRIPPAEVSSMDTYLAGTTPLTLSALHQQEVQTDLFQLPGQE